MNDFSTGGGGGAVGGPTEAPVSIPDTQPASPPVSLDEAIDVGRHTALTQLAKSEDVSEYAQERADEAAVIDRGEEIPQERQNKWFRRASKALADATAEATSNRRTSSNRSRNSTAIRASTRAIRRKTRRTCGSRASCRNVSVGTLATTKN
jgi:hypothetical protein